MSVWKRLRRSLRTERNWRRTSLQDPGKPATPLESSTADTAEGTVVSEGLVKKNRVTWIGEAGT